jgi:hypothetical protein
MVEGTLGPAARQARVQLVRAHHDPVEPSVEAQPADAVVWVEVEDIDLDTGELLGTRLEPVTADSEPVAAADLGAAGSADRSAASWFGARTLRRPSTTRIGVVVPLSSLLGLDDTLPSSCETATRSAGPCPTTSPTGASTTLCR